MSAPPGRRVAVATRRFPLTTACLVCALVLLWRAPARAQGGLLEVEPGDLLSLVVTAEEALSGDYPVTQDGAILLPLVGRIPVAGRTLPEIEVQVAAALGEYLKRPRVNAFLDPTKALRRLYLLGHVRAVGPMQAPAGSTVAEAVGIAGGALPAGDLSRVGVTSLNGEVQVLDLSGMREPGAPLDTYYVRNGDVIRVPISEEAVWVMGQVGRAGKYRLPEQSLTAVEAVTAAEMGQGVTPNAALAQAFVQRKDHSVVPLDLKRIIIEGDTSGDVELSPGDTVVVPLADRVSVVGAVQQAATFGTVQDMTVLEAIVQAGGPLPEAALQQAAVVRGAQRIPIDLEALWRRGDQTDNIELQAGDVLIVPENEAQVLVLGQVQHAGSYLIEPDDKVMDVLSRALPLAPQASPEAARLLRDDEALPLDLRALQEGAVEYNMVLQPGDAIIVPEAQMVYALGNVRLPGKRPWKPGYDLIELLADVGGTGPRAEINKIRLSRQGEYGSSEAMTINLRGLMDGTDPGLPPVLEPGDIVLVPEVRERRYGVWREYRDMLFTVTSLFNIFQ